MLLDHYLDVLVIFSAKAAKDKMNPMLDKLGDSIAHSDLTIIDRPTYSGSFVYLHLMMKALKIQI